nr:retrovirus-related Pol polyprotein from transposon TNT 1-94 [Tanacetum cinerariifolium]
MYLPTHPSQLQICHSSVPPSQQYQSHQTLSVPPISYNSPKSLTQPLTGFSQMDSGRHARVVKCYNCQGLGYMARQCTQQKRHRNATWFKEKAMLTEAHEAGQILDEEQLAFLVDPSIPDGQAT